MLTSVEIGVILNALEHKFGFGYSDAVERDVKIGVLQAKLSCMMEVAARREQCTCKEVK